MNGARGLLGWAGKECWEQGSRGCGWEPEMRGMKPDRGPSRRGEQKSLAEGQAGGRQRGQIASFLSRCWLLVLPLCPPPASTSLGDLAHGLPGITMTFRSSEVPKSVLASAARVQKKERKRIPKSRPSSHDE